MRQDRRSKSRDDRDRDDRRSSSGLSSTASPSVKRSSASSAKDTSPKNSSSKSAGGKDATNQMNIYKLSMDAVRQEEEQAVANDSVDDLLQFRAICDDIKMICEEVKQAKVNKDQERLDQLRRDGSLKFLSLKMLNRMDKFRARDARDKLLGARQKVYTNNLQLQNLMYEVIHLQKECNNCRKFRSKDEDIELISLEEFFAIEPNKRSLEPHQLHLARLECELSQRQQLEEQLKVAEEAKVKCQETISQKRDTLDKLQPMLKMVVEVSQPLFQELSLPLQKSEAINALAEHLPRPLYVLYVQAIAFRHATKARFDVIINGNAEEAKIFELNLNDKDDDDDDEEEERVSRSKKKRHRKSISSAEKIRLSGIKKLAAAHPLSVVFKIEQQGVILTCQFIYVVRLEIVSVRITVDGSNIGHSEVLDDRLLTRLFGQDDGNRSPNPANSYLMSNYGIDDFNQVTSDIGYPYDWVQRIAGLDFINVQSAKEGEEMSIKWINQVVNAIKNRFACRRILQQQLQSLNNGSVDLPVNPQEERKKPKCSLRRLSSLSRSTLEERIANDEQLAELVDSQIIDASSSFVYSLKIERGSANLEALVFVPVNYPTHPPFFRLYHRSDNFHKQESLRDLESLVNCRLPDQLKADRRLVDHLLSYQVHELMLGFDKHLEANDSISMVEGPKEFLPKMSRLETTFSGRDHVIS